MSLVNWSCPGDIEYKEHVTLPLLVNVNVEGSISHRQPTPRPRDNYRELAILLPRTHRHPTTANMNDVGQPQSYLSQGSPTSQAPQISQAPQNINGGTSGDVDLPGQNSHVKKKNRRAFHDLNTPTHTPPPGINAPPPAGVQTPLVPSLTAPANGQQPHISQTLSVANKRYNDQTAYLSSDQLKPFLTFQNAVAPTAGTQYVTVDQGTASAKFMRSTMYNIPENDQLRQASKLPVAVTIRPFAPLLASEEPIPVVDMTQLGSGSGSGTDDQGPIRCRRCRTYMNPSMQHTFNNKFTCNICHFGNNVVPPEYRTMFNPTTNQRTDVQMRPELHKGVYDILVPPSYNVGGVDIGPQNLHHVILIDISINSVKSSLPSLVADTLRMMFNEEEELQGRKVAILLFNKKMHFYNLSPLLESTQVTISADLEDPFVPFYHGLFADVEESRLVIEDALKSLEQIANDDVLSVDDETCFSVALRTAMMCLGEVGGGKISAVLSTIPTWGPGGLKFKNEQTQAARISPEIQKQLFVADNEYYKLLAKDFIKENVGLDCLVVSSGGVDLANIAWLCSMTGGQALKWSNFHHERDARDFSARLINSVVNTKGYQGQLKLRCSNGLQVAEYYGTWGAHRAADPVLPTISHDSSYTVLLEYDGQLSTKNDCHFQAALLYTDPQGTRKVRVINLVLAVSEGLNDIFHFVDQDAVVTTIVRDTLSFIGKQTLTELRDSLNDKLVDIFTQYRAKSELAHNSNRTLTSQLLLPDSLSTLPLFILAFLKSKALKETTSLGIDLRIQDVYAMLHMPIEKLMYHLYPGLIELHSLNPEDGLICDEGLQFVNIPKFIDLSWHKLQDGVYVMGNGSRTLVYIRQNANPLLLQDLFGSQVGGIDDIDDSGDELPELPTEISHKTRNLVRFFNNINGLPKSPSLVQIIKEGNGDFGFKEHLVDDGARLAVSINCSSYTEYLNRLHKAIKTKFDNDKSYSKVKQSITQAEHSVDTMTQRFVQL